MSAAAQVRVVPFRERFMKCASCKSDARWMIYGPDDARFGTTSCERHRELWERRKSVGGVNTSSDTPPTTFGAVSS